VKDSQSLKVFVPTSHLHGAGRDRYIFGHSLGGAITMRLSTEVDDAKGLIVEARARRSRPWSAR